MPRKFQLENGAPYLVSWNSSSPSAQFPTPQEIDPRYFQHFNFLSEEQFTTGDKSARSVRRARRSIRISKCRIRAKKALSRAATVIYIAKVCKSLGPLGNVEKLLFISPSVFTNTRAHFFPRPRREF